VKIFKSIQARLFVSFTAFIVPLIITFGILSYTYISASTTKELSQNELRAANNTISILDLKIKDMDRISLDVTLSKDVTKNINLLNEPSSPSDELEALRSVSDSLYSFIGPLTSVRNINIFNEKLFINEGIISLYPLNSIVKEIYNSENIKAAIALNGNKYITFPHVDPWSSSGDVIISLNRLFKDIYTIPDPVIIEIQQYYYVFKQAIESNFSSSGNKTLMVFDQTGNVIYPIDKTATQNDISYYYKTIQDKNGNGTFSRLNPTSNNRDFITYSYSEYSGWIVVIAEDEKVMLSSINSIKSLTLTSVVIAIILMLIISLFISKRLSDPIKRMHTAIDNIRLDNLTKHDLSKENIQVNELENLYAAFVDMCSRLKVSINESIQSRSRESKAQLLALQSQMNPHFLYNTLSSIGAVSEETGQLFVSKMCKQLADMLRYISTGVNEGVTLKEEIEHSTCYLDLMKMRYENRLTWKLDVDETSMNVLLPKLTIQPLIENGINHGLTYSKKPWEISISCKCVNHRCIIKVSDNGIGFDPDLLNKLSADMEQYSKDLEAGNETSGLKIGGMGIINIYARLRLVFKDHMKFSIISTADTGSKIVIEIPMNSDRKEYYNGKI